VVFYNAILYKASVGTILCDEIFSTALYPVPGRDSVKVSFLKGILAREERAQWWRSHFTEELVAS